MLCLESCFTLICARFFTEVLSSLQPHIYDYQQHVTDKTSGFTSLN